MMWLPVVCGLCGMWTSMLVWCGVLCVVMWCVGCAFVGGVGCSVAMDIIVWFFWWEVGGHAGLLDREGMN